MKVLYNANVLTFDPRMPQASAVVIDAGRILYTGDDGAALSMVTDGNSKQNMNQKTILPGLTDSHIHLEYYALSLERINGATQSVEECLQKVKDKSLSLPAGSWILGHGWNQNDWTGDYSWSASLDDAAPDHPVYLTHKSYHSGWANSKALQLAGIDSNTANPAGGAILKDAAGNPNGILLEDACLLVQKAIPAPSAEQSESAIFKAQQNLWQMGLTGVHDFDRKNCFSALQNLHKSGKLHLRVIKSIPLESLASAAIIGLHSGFGDDMLQIGPVKLFADGALGSKTAAMLMPYNGVPGNSGMLLMESSQLFELGKTAVESGIYLAVHAIGDLANRQVLDGYQMLREYEGENGLPHLRHRIEHVQLLTPEDMGRLAALNLTASMQPTHLTSDMETASQNWGERCRYGYALKSILDSGARLTLGSDAPVEIPNPFHGIHAAITRCRPDGTPGPEGWYPQQRLSLSEALAGYISGPAYASGREHEMGKISTGYLADLIVLPDNPHTLPPDEIRGMLPDAVMVAGDWVFTRTD